MHEPDRSLLSSNSRIGLDGVSQGDEFRRLEERVNAQISHTQKKHTPSIPIVRPIIVNDQSTSYIFRNQFAPDIRVS